MISPAISILSLPAEIQHKILLDLCDWPSLRALIRASPLHLRIYTAAQETIFLRVICNHINSDVTSLTLFRVSEVRKKASAESYSTGLLDQQILLVLKQPEPLTSIELEAARRHLRYTDDLSHYISQYTDSRLDAVALVARTHELILCPRTGERKKLKARDSHLSPLEHSRLRRAFFKLEIYHLICGWKFPARTDTRVELLVIFLQRMPHYEREEFLCVCQFFLDRHRDYQAILEADFMKDFKLRGPEWLNLYPRGTLETFQEDNWLFASGVEWISEGRFEELGLLAGTTRRRRLYEETDPTDRACQNVHLIEEGVLLSSNGLDHLPLRKISDLMCEGGSPNGSGSADSSESLGAANDACKWLLRNLVSFDAAGTFPRSLRDRTMQAMRRWGYAIWDRSRLEALGILANSVSDITSAFHVDLTEWHKRPSVEQRTREQERVWKMEGLLSEECYSMRDYLGDVKPHS